MKKTFLGVALISLCGAVFAQAAEVGSGEEVRPTIAETVTVVAPAPTVEQKLVPSVPALEKPAVRSKHPVEIYGYLKLDASWDNTQIDTGNYARWVPLLSPTDPIRGNAEQFNMTARESRVGLNFLKSQGSRVGGKVEVDFFSASDENKNIPMLRHAYMEWDDAGKDLSVIAGQTSDVISPLAAPMVNYVVGWWCGNIGYRRPQLRLAWGTGRKSAYRSLVQLAASRTIGDAVGSGEASGLPTGQARMAQSFKAWGAKPSVVGVWGHAGRELYSHLPPGATEYVADVHRTTSVGGDVELNLGSKLTVKGEGWWGHNLDAFLGGIGQGVNISRYKPIRARGGWGSISLGPYGPLRLNGGMGFDKPCQEDLNAGDRWVNRMVFGNVMAQLDSAMRLGLEGSRWKTDYKNRGAVEAVRAQAAFYFDY